MIVKQEPVRASAKPAVKPSATPVRATPPSGTPAAAKKAPLERVRFVYQYLSYIVYVSSMFLIVRHNVASKI